ncbi:MAG: hypothetical protein J7M21_04415, partial [Planctomycetes bacterium]|nr:hypothetical protein [Planctomycetota bacterium]
MNLTRRMAVAALLAAGALAMPGCRDGQVATDNADLIAAASRLRRRVDELEKTLARRDRQVANLQALGEKRLEKLYTVRRIALGRATGAVDIDGNTGDDAVKVYLEPIDQYGSVIKAAGEVTIQLYDLAAKPGENLLAQYHYDVEATAGAWRSGFVAYYYVFTCPWKDRRPSRGEVTVRVVFLDYLTGREFSRQTVCTVHLPPA